MAVYLSRSYLDLKKIFTRKRQSIIFHGETNTDGGKKRALIRTVSVLFAAFHPLISECFNMTVLSLFTMWETRGNCTLRQLAVFARMHKHTHTLSLFFPLWHFWSSRVCEVPSIVPKQQAQGAFWGTAMWVFQEMLLPARGCDGTARVKLWSLQEK